MKIERSHAVASGAITLYTQTNYTDDLYCSTPVNHGDTSILGSAKDSWVYQSVKVDGMQLYIASSINPEEETENYLDYTDSSVSSDIPDLPVLYNQTLFPLYYLGIDPAAALAIRVQVNASKAIASTSLIPASDTTFTFLSTTNHLGVLCFLGPEDGDTSHADCVYGNFNSDDGTVEWSGEGSVQLQLVDSTVTISSISGFPDTWTFGAPSVQEDGVWVIPLDVAEEPVISSVTSEKHSITNDGSDTAYITATVQNASSNLFMAGVKVTWDTTLGELSAIYSETDSSGQAIVKLTNNGNTGTCTVTATLDTGGNQSIDINSSVPGYVYPGLPDLKPHNYSQYEQLVRDNASMFHKNFSAHNFNANGCLVTDDIQWYRNGEYFQGREDFISGISSFVVPFPDVIITDIFMTVDGNAATVRYVISGTQTEDYDSPWGLIPASGRAFQLDGTEVLIFNESGKLEYLSTIENLDELRAQLIDE